ncbi:MAG: hypothetical protein NTV08_17780 [Verrucomicrobia bacterium]|nr:hypothetical protein [Verrucomicrobiota bacterium]
MKTEIASKMSRISRALLAAALALAGAASVKGSEVPSNFFNNTIGTVNLGYASGGTGIVVGTLSDAQRHWAIFTLGGNVTITDPTAYLPGSVPSGQAPDSYYSTAGSADVYGNVGIYGSGRLSMTNSYINGFVDEFSSPTNVLAGNGGNPYFLGSIGNNAAYLQQARDNAFAASLAAKNLTPTHTAPGGTAVITTLKDESTAFNINDRVGNDVSAMSGKTYAVNLTDLILQGTSAILTLHGTATTNYVFNIDRYMSLAGGAKINIDGSSGLTAANVLYNVNQNSINGVQYDVTLSGGSEARGIILATTRAVKETGDSKIYGEVIAKSVSLSGASNVINPLVSP